MTTDQPAIAFRLQDLFLPVRKDPPTRNISDEAIIEPCSEKTQNEIEAIVCWLSKSKQAALLDERFKKTNPPVIAFFCFVACAGLAAVAMLMRVVG